MIPRILWNPELDLGTLLDEFCAAWYGPAAKPMREYIEWLHASAMESRSEGVMDCHAGPGQTFFRELYTPEFMNKAYGLFAQAEALTADTVVRKRIAKEKWGLLFTDLYLHGVKPGEILPAATASGVETRLPSLDEYHKVSELLQAHRLFNRPWVINPRQWHHFTLSSIVGCEPDREPWWTTPRIEQLMSDPAAVFRNTQDLHLKRMQRLITLDNQDLQVLVVPSLGGRIWRLYHKRLQADLLRREPLPLGGLDDGLPQTPYVSLGGYEEYVGREFGSMGWGQKYENAIAADGKSVTLTAVFANGLKLVRLIALAPDKPELTVDSCLENTGGQTLNDVVLHVHPEFLTPAGGEMPELLGLGDDGAGRRSHTRPATITCAIRAARMVAGPCDSPKPACAGRLVRPSAGRNVSFLQRQDVFQPRVAFAGS